MTIFVIVGVVIICSFLPLILSNFLPANHGAAVFADVTSANVVGYNNLTANSGTTSFTMMCPNFLKVGNKAGCKLSDLTVTGYVGVCPGLFMLELLKADGTADGGPYYWVELGPKKGWFLKADGSITIPGGAESVDIPAGRAAWCKGAGLKLVSSGELNESLVQFTSNSGTTSFTAIGNAFPVDITLDKLTVTGYTGVCPGLFMLELLKADGTADGGPYYWVELGPKKGWFLKADGSIAIPDGASSVNISAGRGFWCKGAGLTLNIPAPVISK